MNNSLSSINTNAPARSSTSALLQVINLTIAINQNGQWIDLVKGISFVVNYNESVGIVGESGCGKSLTVQAIMRLLPLPDIKIRQGNILFKGIDLVQLKSAELNKIRGNKIAMIFQEPMTALNPVKTIGNQIEEQISLHHPKLTKPQKTLRCLELLNDVGIELATQRLKNYPHQLSGGMRQRVMIAMALSCTPELIIADEPTTALDVNTQAQILELLKNLQNKYQTSLLFISHDLAVIAQICKKVLVMYNGNIVEQAAIDDLFHQSQHPYTQALMLCSPSKNHPRRQPLPSILQAQHANESDNEQRARFTNVLKAYQESQVANLSATNLTTTSSDTHNLEKKHSTILTIRNIHKSFELGSSIFSFTKNNFQAVKNVSFNLAQGETLGIVGTSGSGKTTLAKIVSGLLSYDSGEILFNNKPLDKNRKTLARDIQYIFQDPQESLNSRHTIESLLTEPLKIHKIGTRQQQREKAKETLILVGLPSTILNRYPHEFSGGQKQRIGIARALMLKPKLLICDEPVSALDVSVQAQILNLLIELQEKLHLSIIFITHDLAVVRHIADNIAVMHKGEIVEYGSAISICDQPQENYTQKLIASTPTWPIKDYGVA
jgi:peptide/nickel transport system ATP-binding protein